MPSHQTGKGSGPGGRAIILPVVDSQRPCSFEVDGFWSSRRLDPSSLKRAREIRQRISLSGKAIRNEYHPGPIVALAARTRPV